MILVYIPDENLMGTIVTEMTHGAIVSFEKGGFRREVLMSNEDYVIMDEMFFDIEENE